MNTSPRSGSRPSREDRLEAKLVQARERWTALRTTHVPAADAHPVEVILHAEAILSTARDLFVLDPDWQART